MVEELVVPGESRNIVLFEEAARRMDAYRRLKELLDAKAFDVFVFLDRSRLGRKASLSMAVVELCREAGVFIYETENPPASLDDLGASHDEMLIGAIKSVGAQREVDKMRERNHMGMIARTKRGEIANHPAYGYRIRYLFENGRPQRTIEIDPVQAEVVRKIMAWYLDGAGDPVVTARLNEAGVPAARGGAWQRGHLFQVLDRVWRYAGYAEINRESETGRPYLRAKGNWEPIISEEMAEQVVAERKARSALRRVAKNPYLLSGVVYCRVCGRRKMYSVGPRVSNPTKLMVNLLCSGAHERRYIVERKCMEALRAAIEFIQDKANRDALVEHGRKSQEDHESEIRAKRKADARLRAALTKADDAYVAGLMDIERYRHQVERLRGEMATLQEEIRLLEDEVRRMRHEGKRGERLVEAANAGLLLLDDRDVAKVNAWLRRHVRIWVADNEVVEVEFL